MQTQAINAQNFPAAFAAMDRAAREFWAYPDEEWQEEYLAQWARENNDVVLTLAIKSMKG